MSPISGHEELQELLPAAGLGILEPAELELVLSHVRDCRDCATLLQEYREVAARIALQLPRHQPDPVRASAMRTRLLARAIGSSVRDPDWRTAGHSRRPRFSQWSGWAVAAGMAGLLLIHHSIHRTLDYGWLVAGILVVVLVGVGLYARAQRSRLSALEDHLTDLGTKKEGT